MDAILIPAILEKDFEEIEKKVENLSNYFSNVQIDVIDGIYNQNRTWPYTLTNDSPMSDRLNLVKSLNISFEVDYMAIPNSNDILNWIDVGTSKIILHANAAPSVSDLVEYIKLIQTHNVEAHIGFVVADNIEKYKDALGICDGVQCMGIEKIGMQGQPFTPKVFDLIKNLREFYTNIFISVDGAVNADNVLDLIDNGANQLVSGSALVSGDLEENIARFNRFDNIVLG